MNDGSLIMLASNSPRRRELMALGNWTFSLHVPDVDEAERPGESPAEYVLRLAASKARTAAQHAGTQEFVVAADTAVVDGTTLIGKPAHAAEAVQILKGLRGHSHQVYTGLALLRLDDGHLLQDLCVTDVPMRLYSDAEIDEYVRSGDPYDKAGAYAIQHPKFHPVENLAGCYASVMGLPLCHLVRLFHRMDFASPPDLPDACQLHLNYACPVSSAILRGEQVG